MFFQRKKKEILKCFGKFGTEKFHFQHNVSEFLKTTYWTFLGKKKITVWKWNFNNEK